MKKSLIALAVLGAFAGTAAAQSSVTIYGKLDMGLVKANNGTANLSGWTGNDKVNVAQGAGSRLGFRGQEDLGGGMRAIFNFEHRFDPDTGVSTAGATLWQQAWVGLGGGFGEVALGRDFTPAFYVALAGDPFGYDTIAQAGATHNQLGLSRVRWSNQVRYTSPSMGGFQLRAGWAPKESPGANDKDSMGVNAVYTAGPLYVGLGYDESGVQNKTGGSTNRENYWVLTAAYDFGMIRPGISYASGEAKDAAGTKLQDRTNWTLFASMPLGSGSLRGLYAKRNDDIANTSVKKFGIGYHYDLSKRTKWYVDYGSASETGQTRHSAFDVGIQHNF